MALVNSTYAGKASYPYISPALLELNSLSNNSLTVKQNEKGTAVLRYGTLTNGLEAAACGFSADKPVLKDRVIVLKNLMIVNEICKEDYFNDWEQEQMGDSAWRNTPSDLMTWLTARLLAKGMAGLETMIWQGVTGTDSFDGFETKLTAAFVAEAAGDTPVSAGTGVDTSAAGIIDALGLIVAAASPAVKKSGDFEIILAFDAYENYVASLGGFAAAGQGAAGIENKGTLWYTGQDLTYNGYPVRRANGMTDTYAVASTVENLQFFTALLSDTTSVRMEEREMEEDVRFKAKFDAAVGIGAYSDVVTLNVPIA